VRFGQRFETFHGIGSKTGDQAPVLSPRKARFRHVGKMEAERTEGNRLESLSDLVHHSDALKDVNPMSSIFRMAGVGLVALGLLNGIQFGWLRFPLGGSELSQIGLVLGFAFIVYETLDVSLGRRGRRRHK